MRQGGKRKHIYNSRNYNVVLNTPHDDVATLSTIVEIITEY